MTSTLQQTKFYFENLLQGLWTNTPIHFSGQEFNEKGISKWINPHYTPRGGETTGLDALTTNEGMLYISCWADTDVDAMALGDEIIDFINTNIDRNSYRIRRYEVADHGYTESNKVYAIIGFNIQTLDGC